MLYEALTFVAKELNEYIKMKFGLVDDKVVISNLVNQDGSFAVKEENKVILALAGIQDEKMLSKSNMNAHDGRFSKGRPPVTINLFVLITTTYYGELMSEGLKFLSLIIGFFQGNGVFTSTTSPGLDPNIGKLIFELHNLEFTEQNNLWACMGAKYTPSVLYKVRMITIEEGLSSIPIQPIAELER